MKHEILGEMKSENWLISISSVFIITLVWALIQNAVNMQVTHCVEMFTIDERHIKYSLKFLHGFWGKSAFKWNLSHVQVLILEPDYKFHV
jgi:hypothetical protein